MSELSVDVVKHLDCVGCGACVAACPIHCIGMSYDNEGFLYPTVGDSCVNCGRCQKACPVLTRHDWHEPQAYEVMQLKEKKALHLSASGGVAYGIGRAQIRRGGAVVGCILGDDVLPVHVMTKDDSGLISMQGSKYVQSKITSDCYHRIREVLRSGSSVLFVGTPCQVAGLYGFLGGNPDGLVTVDLVCHGAGSPGVFSYYISKRAFELGGTVVDVRFRCKDVAPYPSNRSLHLEVESVLVDSKHATAKSNTSIDTYCSLALDDPYGSAYYHNRILRESCYRCSFARRERVSDITLGDYFEGDLSMFPSKDGFNFVGINTEKGRLLLKDASDFLFGAPIDMSYKQINLRQPTLRPKSRDKMRRIDCSSVKTATGVDGILGVTLLDRIKRLLPAGLKDSIKMIIGRVKRH